MSRYTINWVHSDGTLQEQDRGDVLAYAKEDCRAFFLCNEGRSSFCVMDTKTGDLVVQYTATTPEAVAQRADKASCGVIEDFLNDLDMLAKQADVTAYNSEVDAAGGENAPARSVRPMFIVYDYVNNFREAAFGSFDEAEEYRQRLSNHHLYLIEAVVEDEDLYHSINR